MAFCINLNKQFIVVKRDEFNSRIESLLSLVGLTERMQENDVDMAIVDKTIDFDKVNEILCEERKKTLALFGEKING